MDRTFDPASETQKLRDHLASHDKPIAFLFGAGTSAAVSGTDGAPLIPAVAELTTRCAAAAATLGTLYDDAWKAIVAALPADRRTIEDILSSVRLMREAVIGADKLAGLSADELKTLEETIQQAISREVRPDPGRYPVELPHRSLGRWIGRVDRSDAVEIFTTNYDTLLERALEDEWVPVFDGFVGAHHPFFSAASLAREPMAPGRRWTRVWKIHGSVTWALEKRPGSGERIIRGEEGSSGELILPSLMKYDESRKQPYVAMMDRLRRVLTDREDAILVTSGYSFGDQHINEVIFEALDTNPRLHVFALCFSDPDASSELGREARRRTNILVLGPAKAIVGTHEGEWLMQDPTTNGPRMAGLFETATVSSGSASGGAAAVGGLLKLGDFNVLCRLLDQIARRDA